MAGAPQNYKCLVSLLPEEKTTYPCACKGRCAKVSCRAVETAAPSGVFRAHIRRLSIHTEHNLGHRDPSFGNAVASGHEWRLFMPRQCSQIIGLLSRDWAEVDAAAQRTVMPAERASPARKPQGSCTAWDVEARNRGTSHGRVMSSTRHVHSGRSRCSPNGPGHRRTTCHCGWTSPLCRARSSSFACEPPPSRAAMGFMESTLHNGDAMERMLQHLIERGLGTGRGLECVGGSTPPCRSTWERL